MDRGWDALNVGFESAQRLSAAIGASKRRGAVLECLWISNSKVPERLLNRRRAGTSKHHST
jgi:hypothetical protein